MYVRHNCKHWYQICCWDSGNEHNYASAYICTLITRKLYNSPHEVRHFFRPHKTANKQSTILYVCVRIFLSEVGFHLRTLRNVPPVNDIDECLILKRLLILTGM